MQPETQWLTRHTQLWLCALLFAAVLYYDVASHLKRHECKWMRFDEPLPPLPLSLYKLSWQLCLYLAFAQLDRGAALNKNSLAVVQLLPATSALLGTAVAAILPWRSPLDTGWREPFSCSDTKQIVSATLIVNVMLQSSHSITLEHGAKCNTSQLYNRKVSIIAALSNFDLKEF